MKNMHKNVIKAVEQKKQKNIETIHRSMWMEYLFYEKKLWECWYFPFLFFVCVSLNYGTLEQQQQQLKKGSFSHSDSLEQ